MLSRITGSVYTKCHSLIMHQARLKDWKFNGIHSMNWLYSNVTVSQSDKWFSGMSDPHKLYLKVRHLLNQDITQHVYTKKKSTKLILWIFFPLVTAAVRQKLEQRLTKRDAQPDDFIG